jgi:hypothetical protein
VALQFDDRGGILRSMGDAFQEYFSEIIATALEQRELHGIVEILKKIAELVHACGCILWETDHWADLRSSPRTGKLYVFASWFEDGIRVHHRELLVEKSANGLAIATEEPINIDDLGADHRTHKDDYSIRVANLTSMYVVPIKFDSDQYNASLSVYRREVIKGFNPSEREFIGQVANLIPALYQAVRDKVRHNLLSDTAAILFDAEQKAKANNDDPQIINDGLQKVCERVAESIQCLETSLFLENRLEEADQFSLRATTHTGWKDEKRIYSPDRTQGLTGWALEMKKSVAIFDLAHFEKDIVRLRQEYEGVQWNDSLDIKSIVKNHFDLPDSSLPPLSFMAVPIVRDTHLLGVIRCCAAKKDPWFFSTKRQMVLLESVATQLHGFWNDWLQHLKEKEESRIWKTFIERIRDLNQEVRRAFEQSGVKETRLLEQTLTIARDSIRNSDILAIRLRDDITNELYFAATLGFPKANGADNDIETKRVSIDKTLYDNVPLSILVFEEGRARLVTKDDYKCELFPETRLLLVAPIGVRETVGVLEIRSLSNKPLPTVALPMAELIGQQLGLYLSLCQSEIQQRHVYEDLWHQLKGPVRQTFARANALIHSVHYKTWDSYDYENVEDIKYQLVQLRGLARKAKSVAISAGVLKEFSPDDEPNFSKIKKVRLTTNVAVKILTDAADDTNFAIEDYRDIKVLVNETSLVVLESTLVKVDLDFFEQAVNCLLDNAGKYSFPKTTIRVSGSLQHKSEGDFFVVLVTNQGIKVWPGEVPHMSERNYRGAAAMAATGEGSGIGLWVVNRIMRSHSGFLEIEPTNSRGFTRIRLLFPAEATVEGE